MGGILFRTFLGLVMTCTTSSCVCEQPILLCRLRQLRFCRAFIRWPNLRAFYSCPVAFTGFDSSCRYFVLQMNFTKITFHPVHKCWPKSQRLLRVSCITCIGVSFLSLKIFSKSWNLNFERDRPNPCLTPPIRRVRKNAHRTYFNMWSKCAARFNYHFQQCALLLLFPWSNLTQGWACGNATSFFLLVA